MVKMATSDFDKVEGRLAIMLKDLHMVSDVAKRTGAVMPVTSLVEQLHRQLDRNPHSFISEVCWRN
jgi:3-hydroxyisobutyrate dehydrogenase-like beta-hydroxyacid dehydrogenase